MTRHVSTENLARFRDGDLRGHPARRTRAHLQRCERCRETSAGLADIPGLLASAGTPQMPAHLATRIENALAAEAARRSSLAGGVSAGAGPAERTEAGARGSHRRRDAALPRRALPRRALPRLAWSRPAVRALATATAVVVLGGGGYALVSQLGQSVPSTTAGSSAAGHGQPRHDQARGSFGRRPAGGPAYGPPVRYGSDAHAQSVRPMQSATDYRSGQLASQVTKTLAGARGAQGSAGSARGSEPMVPQAHRFSFTRLGQLSGCLSRVAAGGRTVLLVDLSRFQGKAATVIVTAGPGTAATQAWVVGTACSRSDADVLAHRVLRG